jgi:large subunit ribosomal protein L25
MEQKTLEFAIRDQLKKGPSRRLRRAGKIPSIIYGKNEPVNIAIDDQEFNEKFHRISESTIITLKSGDKSYDVLVKDYQEDIIKGKILHIDFYEIEKGRALKTHVSIRFIGTPEGVKEGGFLESLTYEIEVECLPKDLPKEIEVDISPLNVGQSIHALEIPEIPGVKYLMPPDQVICTIAVPKEEKEVIEEVEEEELEAEGVEEGEEEEKSEKEAEE